MEPLNKRLQLAEAEAFVELYDQLGDRLYRYVLARTGGEQDALDITQEIFLRLVKSHRSLAKADNLAAYVFSIARTETIRWHNKAKARKTQPVSDIGQASPLQDNTTNFTDHVDGSDWINQTLAKLEPIDREIVQLKIFSRLTFREIAEVVKLTQANVATRYRRAIATIEQQITNDSISLEHEQ